MLIQKLLVTVARSQKFSCHLGPTFQKSIHLTRYLNEVNRTSEKTNQTWLQHEKEDETRQTGIKLVKQEIESEEESCLYPTFRTMGVETEGKIHKFNVPCDRVIKFIKLGAINKMIGIQYCHYLAHLARCSKSQEETTYFAKRCFDLMTYLMKQTKDMTAPIQAQLQCDVANTTSECCTQVCRQVLDQSEVYERFARKDLTKLINSCYTHGLWSLASELILKGSDLKVTSFRLVDGLVEGLIKKSSEYKVASNYDDKKKMRAQIIDHMKKFSLASTRDRAQFITKYPQEFVTALQDLDVSLVKNPVIKAQGRCTNCGCHLPVFDGALTKDINELIKGLLYERVAEAKRLYLNTTPKDLESFEDYLKNLFNHDKKPIDCVIDGLNLAYRNSVGYNYSQQVYSDLTGTAAMRTVRKHNPTAQTQVLVNTILRGNMLEKFKKILVIGKMHMRSWPGLVDFFNKHRIHFYTSNNSSKDDLFQLYAATLNPKTIVITNDFFRDHTAMFHGVNRVKLERWIDTHQAWIANKNLRPVWPTIYEKIPSLSENEEHFHIPVIDYNKFDTIAFHEPPPHLNSNMTKWICCSLNESADKE